VIVSELSVFGMHFAQEEFIIWFEVFGIESKHVIDFIRPVKFIGEEVSVPVTQAGDVFGVSESGFALAEGLFILFYFGDVSAYHNGLIVGEGDDSGFSPSFLVMDVEGIFEGSHFLGGEGLFDGGEELIGHVGREDVGEVFSDDILFAPDGLEAFGAKDFFVDAVSADADKHIGDGLEDELVGDVVLDMPDVPPGHPTPGKENQEEKAETEPEFFRERGLRQVSYRVSQESGQGFPGFMCNHFRFHS